MPLLVLALFIAVPLAEVFLFAEVGGAIGAWPTVGLVVLTAVVGLAMVRMQGMAVLARAQANMEREEPPVVEVLEGLGLLLAGVFLFIPGFFTDAVGFALLIPPLRIALIRWLWGAAKTRGGFRVYPGRDGPTVVDAEYEDVTPDASPEDGAGSGDRLPPKGGRTGGGAGA